MKRKLVKIAVWVLTIVTMLLFGSCAVLVDWALYEHYLLQSRTFYPAPGLENHRLARLDILDGGATTSIGMGVFLLEHYSRPHTTLVATGYRVVPRDLRLEWEGHNHLIIHDPHCTDGPRRTWNAGAVHVELRCD